MPGQTSWKGLYQAEYLQLEEEGYDVSSIAKPDMSDIYLPLDDEKRDKRHKDDLSEAEYEKAYYKLWKVRDKGIRPDFPFVEPNDFEEIIGDASEPPFLTPLTTDEYAERIKGAWFGRCAGVVLGKPLELNIDRLKIKEYLESVDAYPLNDWVPYYSKKLNMKIRNPECCRGNVQFVSPDDDTHYTILALMLAEQKGLNFTPYDAGMNYLGRIPYTWVFSATGQSYYHLVNLVHDRPREEQIAEIPTKLNPFREGINGAIRADFWGYIAPGDPRRAARLAFNEVSLNVVKNGLYGAMFTAACISTALSKNPTIDTILQGGLSVIPKKSRLAQVVDEVVRWYTEKKEWVPVCDKIYEKYGHLPFAHSLNNMAMVVLALLHGNMDYTKTITTAVMCGKDTDCNSGTAGSIVGSAIGYENLDPRWISPLNNRIKAMVAGFSEGSITGLVDRTVNLWIKVKDQPVNGY